MAYVHVLAVVLCCFFIQDALSAEGPGRVARKTAVPETIVAPQKLTKGTAAVLGNKAGKKAGIGAGVGAGAGAGVGAGAGAKQTVTTKTVKRTTTRSAAAPPPPPPPPKYPNLARAADVIWTAAEEMNRANETGKLTVRAVRNAIEDALTSGEFWSTAESALRRRVKLANDPERADRLIGTCDALTAALSGPVAAHGLEKLAGDVYEAAVDVRSDACVDALQAAAAVVDGGLATDGLVAANEIVSNVDLSADLATRMFKTLRTAINRGSAVNVNGGMANGIARISHGMQRRNAHSAV